MPGLTIAALTPDAPDEFLALFGPSGACYGCWCQHFRLPPKVRQTLSGEAKRELMVARIRQGPPPGLLAWKDGAPVGWMQIGPRADVPEWSNPRRATTPLPDTDPTDPAVWAISCFFFARKARGRGLSHAMVEAGLDHARRRGARLVEAAPMDRARSSASLGLFVGSTSVFAAAGFTEVARQKQGRPLMRRMLPFRPAPSRPKPR